MFWDSDDDTVKVEWPYRRSDVRKAQRKALAAKRCDAVRELRTNTLIDLVTLDENEAKAVVSKFRTAAEAI